MRDKQAQAAERTAVRVALWRALHVMLDPPPHVFHDEIGLQLAAPDEGWRRRPDMGAQSTRRARASIVARARFIEDLVVEQAGQGVLQYVILGAGLDTFAQRRPDLTSGLRVFEVDAPGPQAWKQRRLEELGLAVPPWLRFVPVDFEAGVAWLDLLVAAGFDPSLPAVVASTGVAMYLTREANVALLQQVAGLAAGSTLVLSFMLPLELVDEDERAQRQSTERFAAMAGTPFLSLLSPTELLSMARDAGLRDTTHVSSSRLTDLYFAERTDELRPSSSEELIVAKVG